ncbi:MAG: hydrogenase maturation nickel metallochaperone HypA [Aridibacter famidurans]|nr:hydrogenase maturation nickel metallochaperone HypA [Aridibacter famidurans]
MAIVQSVLDIAFSEAEKHSSRKVSKIKLRIGELSGVVSDSIEFAFEVLRQGTLAEEAALEIEPVPLRVVCRTCGPAETLAGDLALICKNCGSGLEIVSGREMKVEYIDLD